MATENGQRQTLESKRLLVVSLDNLGDLVFASALLPALRECFPSGHIAVWCKKYSSGLGPLLPAIDEIYSADPFWGRSPGGKKGSLSAFLRTVRSIRHARFDTAILCFAPWRTAAAVASLGIPVRVGLERRRNRRWLTHLLPAEDRGRPVLDEVSRLLEPFGIRRPLSYRLDVTGLDIELAAVRSAIGGQRIVALHPFAGSENRCVKLTEWLNVATELSSLGIKPLWIGTSTELHRLRQLGNTRSEWRYTDVLFDGSLTKVALAISTSALFVGHDSGPLHIAAALNVPSVAIFAPGEPARTFPQGSGRWRMIARSSPQEISAQDILAEARILTGSS
jgi:ADP-heptose:LPS heptosyltransferase